MTHPQLTPIREAILLHVKRSSPVTVAQVSEAAELSYEAARQHLTALESSGWVERRTVRDQSAGRPEGRYRLTLDGEQLFDKSYDVLAVALIDAIADRHGIEEVREVLAGLVDAKVAAWAPKIAGKSTKEQLEILKAIYSEDDSFTEVVEDERGLKLIERNCPFLSVALERPALCSLTVSALTRLIGYRLKRESSFQAGDGCCAFRVQLDEPVDPADFRFEFEG